MKTILGVIAGISVGLAVIYFFLIEPSSERQTGYGSVEDTARDAYDWGTRQRIKAKAETFAGAAREGIGRLTGDDNLAGEGLVDQAVGSARDAAGQFGHAVGETIHDLNR